MKDIIKFVQKVVTTFAIIILFVLVVVWMGLRGFDTRQIISGISSAKPQLIAQSFNVGLALGKTVSRFD